MSIRRGSQRRLGADEAIERASADLDDTIRQRRSLGLLLTNRKAPP